MLPYLETTHCKNGKVWTNCTDMMQTCETLNDQYNNAMSCVKPGCACPTDKVLKDGQCVNVKECPCHFEGKHFIDLA